MSPDRPGSAAALYLAALLRQVSRRLIDTRCPQVAASLAFTTLLALVPLLTVGLIVFSSLPGFAQVADQLKAFMLQNLLPATAGKIIATYAVQFSQKAANLTVIGTTIVIVTAVMLILTIDKAFSQIWAVGHRRPLIARLSMYWAGLTIGPMVLAVVVALVGQLASLSVGWLAPAAWSRQLLGQGTTFLILASVFALMYAGLPNRPVLLRHALVGGVLSALLLALVQKVFALYLAKFPTYTLIYGTFAALPIFLIWMYLSWLAVLLGAVLVAVLPEVSLRGKVREPFPGDRVLDALRLLDALSAAQAAGRTCALEALAARTGLGLVRCSELLEELSQAGWVVSSEAGHWLLATRCDCIRLRDLLERLSLSTAALAGGGDPLGRALAERLRAIGTPLELPVSELIGAAGRTPDAPPDQIG